jgi:hypothetical protein
VLVLCLTLAACFSGDVGSAPPDGSTGGDDLNTTDDINNPDGNSILDGTSNGLAPLQVVIEVNATEDRPDGELPDDFSTDITATVFRAGEAVQGAQIKVTASTTELTLTPLSQAGSYGGSHSSYHQLYAFELVVDGQQIDKTELDGPAIHEISQPEHDTLIHESGDPLDVVWSPSGAMEATIETSQLPSTPISDSGSYTVDGSYLINDDTSQELEDFVIIHRKNTRTIPGATPDSSFSIRIRNQVDFEIVNSGS